jgi:hypothetical protein
MNNFNRKYKGKETWETTMEYMKTYFKETGYLVWSECKWLRAETTDVPCEHGNEFTGPIHMGNLLTS